MNEQAIRRELRDAIAAIDAAPALGLPEHRIPDAVRAAVQVIAPLWYRELHRAAVRSGASAADADDIIQKVLLEFTRRLHETDFRRKMTEPEAGPHGYLFRMIRSGTVDLLRGRRSETSRRERAAREPPPPAAGPDSLLEDRAELRLLETAIQRLDPLHRAVIEAYREGLDDTQIASRLRLSPENVRQRRHRALLRLRQLVEELLSQSGPRDRYPQ